MAWIAPVIGGILGLWQANKAGQAASAADAQAKEQIAMQKELQDYMLGKRKKIYDPLEEQVVIPGLMRRYEMGPFYADKAMGQASRLRASMKLPPQKSSVQKSVGGY